MSVEDLQPTLRPIMRLPQLPAMACRPTPLAMHLISTTFSTMVACLVPPTTILEAACSPHCISQCIAKTMLTSRIHQTFSLALRLTKTPQAQVSTAAPSNLPPTTMGNSTSNNSSSSNRRGRRTLIIKTWGKRQVQRAVPTPINNYKPRRTESSFNPSSR